MVAIAMEKCVADYLLVEIEDEIAERQDSMFNARTTNECSWSKWGECSESCGNGFMERVRINTAGQSGKEKCNGLPKETKRCQIRNNNCEDVIKKRNSNVDIAFMMDATGSMGSNIKRVKNEINNIVARVHSEFEDAVIRVAFVAYRDYGDRSKHFEIFDFTENITLFTDFLDGVRADGGGDGPEDVLGAIDKTIKLTWKAANRIFYQCGDWPPRGFCNPGGSCTLTSNDTAGPQAPELFRQINENCLKYNVMQISSEQNYMVQQFEKIAAPYEGDERFHVYDMTDGSLDFDTVSDSILESIRNQLKATNDYLNNPGSVPNRCIKL